MQFVIDQGVDVNTGSPLHYAVVWRNYEAAVMLLRHGADITAISDKKCLLKAAVATGDIKLISLVNNRLLRLHLPFDNPVV